MDTADTDPPQKKSSMAARGGPNRRERQPMDTRLGQVERQAQVLLYMDEPETDTIVLDEKGWDYVDDDCLEFKFEPGLHENGQCDTNPQHNHFVEPMIEDDAIAASSGYENNEMYKLEIGGSQRVREYFDDYIHSSKNLNNGRKVKGYDFKQSLKCKLSNNIAERIKEEAPETDEKGKKNKVKMSESREKSVAKFNAGSHYCISPSFTLFPTIEEIARTELGDIILRGELDRYFGYMAHNLKPLIEGDQCRDDCMCKDEYLLSRKMGYHITPLHLAVSINQPKFVFLILDNATIKYEFSQRIADKTQRESVSAHYRELTINWLLFKEKNVRTSAFELAAELGEIENVNAIFNSRKGYLALENSQNQEYKRYDYEECFVHQHLKDQSVLSGLIESDTYHKLEPPYAKILVDIMRNSQVDHAICAALEKGNTNLVSYIAEVHNQHRHLDEKYLSENWEAHSGFVKNGPFPPSHLLAYNSLYKEFNSLPEEFRTALDLHGRSALPLLLGFEDDQVMEQMRLFRGMRREDLFNFVKEIIVTKRRSLLEPALQMALSNPDNFTPNPQENHLPYGLPGSVTMPLEMAILNVGDMTAVDDITKAYSKQDTFSENMCEEDCLRCLKGIQDIATKMTDQSRLALILILLPFVDVFSKRFKDIIHMYHEKSGASDVGDFVVSEYATMKSRFYKKRKTHVLCVQAMKDARVAVKKWNGDLEVYSPVPKLNSRIKKIKTELPNDLQGISITVEKKVERQQRRKADEEKESDDRKEKIRSFSETLTRVSKMLQTSKKE